MQFYQSETVTSSQLRSYLINENGNSELPFYAGSIFSIFSNPPRPLFDAEGEVVGLSRENWTVIRIPEQDLELPLNEKVCLTWQQISALNIRENGLSDRPNLSRYKFEVTTLDSGSTFEVIKTKK